MSKELRKNIKAAFRLKPIRNENEDYKAICKYVGYVTPTQKLGDQIVHLDKIMHPDSGVYGKNAIPLKKVGTYDMIGKIYWSNIIDSYIVVGKRYPLLYLTVEYYRTIANGSLCQFIISLDIDNEQKKEIKNNSEYKNLKMKGKWVFHFDGDQELFDNYEENLKYLLEDEYSEMENPSLDLDEYVSIERQKYDYLFKEREFKFQTVTKARDYLIDLVQSDIMNKFLTIAMDCRRVKRINDHGGTADFNFKIPDNTIKMNDVINKLKEDDEFILDDF
jgi:hypothetical protein